jgi:FixJ family two-component response regulator
MYVVVVDDEAEDIRRITDCLPDCSFTKVESFGSPEELASLMADVLSGKRAEPALVLLDMKIGSNGEAGLQMLRDVRAAFPHMPVIMVSGSKLRGVIVESYKRGAVSYIHKSLREGVFENRLQDMFLYFSETTKIPANAELPEH